MNIFAVLANPPKTGILWNWNFFHPSGTRRVLVRLGLHGLWGHSREVFWMDVRSPHPKTHMLGLPTNGFMGLVFFSKGKCSWIYFQSQLLLGKIFSSFPKFSDVTLSTHQLWESVNSERATEIRGAEVLQHNQRIFPFHLHGMLFPWQNYCFLSFNYHVC